MPARFWQRLAVVFFTLTLGYGCATHHRLQRNISRQYEHDLITSKYYKVKSGDTLYSIGHRSGHDYHQLAAWNHIHPPYKIKTGQTIKLFKPNNPSSIRKKAVKRLSITQKKRNTSQKKSSFSISNEKVLTLYWQWPLKGRILKTYSQSGNKGIDIQAKAGQLIEAAAKGKVVYSGSGLIGYGKLLIIKHNDRFLSAYAYNRRLLVKEGQKVKKGQIIAEVGKNSNNKFSLHFEIRKNGQPVNPVNYLPK